MRLKIFSQPLTHQNLIIMVIPLHANIRMSNTGSNTWIPSMDWMTLQFLKHCSAANNYRLGRRQLQPLASEIIWTWSLWFKQHMNWNMCETGEHLFILFIIWRCITVVSVPNSVWMLFPSALPLLLNNYNLNGYIFFTKVHAWNHVNTQVN